MPVLARKKSATASRITQDYLRLLHFGNKFETTIPKSTISDILRNSATYLNYDTEDNNQVRMRAAKYPALEEALYLWYSEMRIFKAQNITKYYIIFHINKELFF
jgi:hypothetical protein